MVQFHLVDAFSISAFHGNPAAVFILDSKTESSLTSQLMQSIAFEFNWPATVFVQKIANNDKEVHDDNKFSIRWFAPKEELPLCGHGTLAASHVLFETTSLSSLRFISKMGELMVSREMEDKQIWISMSFPKIEMAKCPIPKVFVDSIKPIAAIKMLEDDYMYVAILKSPQDVKDLEPDLSLIKTLPKGMIGVTAKVSEEEKNMYHNADFVSRIFAPQIGIPEDHVCGSFHARLAPLWAEPLALTDMTALQLSERRGVLKLKYEKNAFHGPERVIIKGQAVSVANGTLFMKNLKKTLLNL